MYDHTDKERLLLAVDCIIFGFDGEKLKILLIKRGFEPERGKWSLVGGFLHKSEVLHDAATRILNRYTGLDDIYMEQVGTFSDIDRDPEERTVSTAYYALINIKNHSQKLNRQFSAQWFSVEEAPPLIFDHDKMVRHALKRLRTKAETEPIGFELLPEKFTMRQLQNLYEAIWNVSLDKRNFISKVRSLDILEKLDEKDKTSSRKGSFLYRFDAEKYKTVERNRSSLNL
ncbi:ADP-ribose pyrophosphatase YjhB (NUDIX family) [Lewinella marina]|uniref:DNA mismatch repair protein MutT n=1 Tax=Neolewinella marina TaxID=438751 RepID=A0A2G0CAY5_9BACT|nr:NUDIX domain-containing protein [Neolewinella marina]NJB84279.1 ADP-ribose pyrophosphatase YjhB (NUDIX family) [Neolewinella marina]PHK97138.1 DNA mismatch repair protein MutT [Neolewinella marina]